jgi:hypothetical protein
VGSAEQFSLVDNFWLMAMPAALSSTAPLVRKSRARSWTPFRNIFLKATPTPTALSSRSGRTNKSFPMRASLWPIFSTARPIEVVFGQNMTTITLGLSRAIGRELKPGDEILLTTLDHDANFSPWAAHAEKAWSSVKWTSATNPDCTLDLNDLKDKLNAKTKLVAVGYASNAVGSINPVADITRLAHAAGALCFIDAVH